MKNRIIFFVLCAVYFASCQTNPTDEYEQKVLNMLHSSITEAARKPESVAFSNEQFVFNQDSLCIVHLSKTAENIFGNTLTIRMEYIGFQKDGVFYEFFDELTEDSVWVNETEYQRNKKGTFYENCPYSVGIKYRSIQKLNSDGHIVGDKTTPVNLENPLGTGNWVLCQKQDEFGEYTSNTYIELDGNGKFSNSATTDADLRVVLHVELQKIYLHFYLYGRALEKDSWTSSMKVKSQDEDILNFPVKYTEDGILIITDPKGIFARIIMAEGKISCSIKDKKRTYNTYKDSYKWSLNLDGYNKAKEFIK